MSPKERLELIRSIVKSTPKTVQVTLIPVSQSEIEEEIKALFRKVSEIEDKNEIDMSVISGKF